MKNNHRENLSEPDGQERSLGETIRLTYKSEKKPAFRHSNRKLDRRNSGAKALESGCTRCFMGKERRLLGQHEGKRETNRMGDGKQWLNGDTGPLYSTRWY